MIPALLHFWHRLRDDRRGLGAVEFAIIAPFLLLLYLGGYQLMDATSAYRKVTTTTRTLADVTTQFTAVQASDVDSILGAAGAVMTPYSASNTTTRVSEIAISATGMPSVVWSRASSGNLLKTSDLLANPTTPNNVVPAKLRIASTNLIFAEVSYSYVPPAGGQLIGPITFRDQIFMNPRRSVDIPCTGC
ncbi:TadE/TadG family type IV pilus assembly protein [Sphingomonas lycopersici]|uniref:Pilus assembly protein n=1 Tax=Sphingomonas lycopersici TaxID=2951807 RepID=A0AA42CVB6_9SPHN|nr:pilus assembly protein [Sphingomonas lycopersici]